MKGNIFFFLLKEQKEKFHLKDVFSIADTVSLRTQAMVCHLFMVCHKTHFKCFKIGVSLLAFRFKKAISQRALNFTQLRNFQGRGGGCVSKS